MSSTAQSTYERCCQTARMSPRGLAWRRFGNRRSALGSNRPSPGPARYRSVHIRFTGASRRSRRRCRDWMTMSTHLPAKRLGLNVPTGWWAAPSLLKPFEAAGFGRVQIQAPPARILSDTRLCTSHAAALAQALATTALEPVVHAPPDLTLGTRASDLAGEGLLIYAAEIGATHVVYHACARPDFPESQDALLFEARSLAARARRAERPGGPGANQNPAPAAPCRGGGGRLGLWGPPRLWCRGSPRRTVPEPRSSRPRSASCYGTATRRWR